MNFNLFKKRGWITTYIIEINTYFSVLRGWITTYKAERGGGLLHIKGGDSLHI